MKKKNQLNIRISSKKKSKLFSVCEQKNIKVTKFLMSKINELIKEFENN